MIRRWIRFEEIVLFSYSFVVDLPYMSGSVWANGTFADTQGVVGRLCMTHRKRLLSAKFGGTKNARITLGRFMRPKYVVYEIIIYLRRKMPRNSRQDASQSLLFS